MAAQRNPIEWEDLTFNEKLALKNKAESSLLSFTRIFFELLQGDIMMVNWHHRYMCQKFEELMQGKIKNLAINVPPGGTKTELFSIGVPAYLAALVASEKLKKFRNLNISFSDSLVKRNSRRTKGIIGSAEFSELWSLSFGVNQAEEWDLVNDKNKVIGQTVSRSALGQITGGRGGFPGEGFSGIVGLDDYNKPDDMFSATKRENSNRVAVNTIRSRRGDKTIEHPTPLFSIQQRLHVEDITGFFMSGGMGLEFDLLAIPALISMDYINTLPEPFRQMCIDDVCDSPSVIYGGVKHWSYWPANESVYDLLALSESDDYTFLSQYMQDPPELSGGLIKSDWFSRHYQVPKLVWRAVYVDTNAGTVGDANDFTVFTLAGLGVDGKCYIIEVVRSKFDPEDLLKTAIACWEKWKPTTKKQQAVLRYMAIENKQAGQGLITTLKKKKKIPIKPVERGTGQNKFVRCMNCQPHIKSGMVSVPYLSNEETGNHVASIEYFDGSHAGGTDWVTQALGEAASFKADDSHKNDDVFDTWMDAIDDMLINSRVSMSQAL